TASVTFVSAVSAVGSCSQSGGSVTCNIGNLEFGASVTITILVTPTSVGTLNNTASVTAAENDPVTLNNTATASTTVVPKADLSLAKSASPNPVSVNSPLTYMVTVTNHGPSPATGVTIIDALPSSVNLVSANASQ